MRNATQPFDPNPGRPTRIFAALAVVFIAVLGSAPLRPYFTEWREAQSRYNRLAEASGVPVIAVAIQQIWKPKLGVTDRCVTCHLGMGMAGPVPGDALFRAHSPIPHDPREYGCTPCHGGQGRATTRTAAHGFVKHWDEAMLEPPHLQSGCGTCHDRPPVVSRRELERGRHLFESLDCLACHRVDGRGRTAGSDLSYAALKGFRSDWHAWHLKEKERDTSGRWAPSYGDVAPADLAAIEAFQGTRVGMPRVVEAQSLAFERGCLGCHKIGGRGGDEGPALDAAGRRPVGDLDFSRLPGESTLTGYMRRHLLDPSGVVAGSAMPPLAGDRNEADLLTTFVLFLRGRDLPAGFLPRGRVRRQVLGEPEPSLAGDQIFGAYCIGCHGPAGGGRNWGHLEMRFPAIGLPDFLDVASDFFIRSTLETGRAGRKMPALAAPGGSLRPDETSAVVAYLRSLEPAPAGRPAVEAAAAAAARGREVYQRDCAACHGRDGEGTALGSPLATPDSRVRGNRAAAYAAIVDGIPATAMPRYRIYDARILRSLIDAVMAQPTVSGSRAAWRAGSGSAESGRALFARACAGCHGSGGAGRSGPALANPGFLKAADAAFIATTIVRGRAGTPMPAFGRDSAVFRRLGAADVLDLTAFIRAGLPAGGTTQ